MLLARLLMAWTQATVACVIHVYILHMLIKIHRTYIDVLIKSYGYGYRYITIVG